MEGKRRGLGRMGLWAAQPLHLRFLPMSLPSTGESWHKLSNWHQRHSMANMIKSAVDF